MLSAASSPCYLSAVVRRIGQDRQTKQWAEAAAEADPPPVLAPLNPLDLLQRTTAYHATVRDLYAFAALVSTSDLVAWSRDLEPEAWQVIQARLERGEELEGKLAEEVKSRLRRIYEIETKKLALRVEITRSPTNPPDSSSH